MAGYSGTPLVKKLGIKLGIKAKFINTPKHYFELLPELDIASLDIIKNEQTQVDFIHLFTTQQADLIDLIGQSKKQLSKSGMIWVSWPKKASKIPTDLNENLIRDLALSSGLVDVKVCAVDEDWSGLKLVYRLKDR